MPCRPDDPASACSWRYEAVRSGRFVFSWSRGGWLWRESRSPDTPWNICPGCGGALPTLEHAVLRLRDLPLDAWDGDE